MKEPKNKIKTIIAAAIAAAVLIFAFWYGGSAPGSRGFAAPAAAPVQAEADTQTPVQTAVPSAAPKASPSPAAQPSPAAKKEKGQNKPSCTISISCAALLQSMDALDKDKRELVPADGVILAPTKAEFAPGESVFDVLRRVCRDKGIQMESNFTPAYDSAYIEGIANLYEFDAGEKSGWMYSVNGAFPGFGSSKYALSDGDTVCWAYTTDLGADVGA